jgi:hypothetical protein
MEKRQERHLAITFVQQVRLKCTGFDNLQVSCRHPMARYRVRFMQKPMSRPFIDEFATSSATIAVAIDAASSATDAMCTQTAS